MICDAPLIYLVFSGITKKCLKLVHQAEECQTADDFFMTP